MPAYKIKHKPTGLFFTRSRDISHPNEKYKIVKSNLSKRGKVYDRKPSDKQLHSWLGRNIRNEYGDLISCDINDFELIEV